MDDITFDKGRVISFSDAVFSIAMTLLILEIGIPSYEAVNSNGTWGVLINRIPSFIGLLVSFLVTALYWIAHMRVMKYVSDIDNKLLWLNIFLLLFIVLLPFSTAFYVRGFNFTGPFVFYCFNLSAIGLFNYLMLRYVIKKEKGTTGLTPFLGKWQKARALNAFFVWVFAGILVFILPTVARFTFILIFIIQPMINYYFRKKIRITEIDT